MDSLHLKTATFVLLAFMVVVLFMGTEATYRKPPFNGSIFGKRGATAGTFKIPIFKKVYYLKEKYIFKQCYIYKYSKLFLYYQMNFFRI